MRAISLRQPWANLVASGKKTVETRTWPTKVRGDVLIVSSKSPDIAPAGMALAIVEIVGCRPMTAGDEEAACCAVYPRAQAWVLRNVRRIEPFPVRGRLGFYEVALPAAVRRFLRHASQA